MKNKKRLNKRTAVLTPASSITTLINYSEDLQILEVEYTEDRIYHYKDVELEKWEEYKSWVEEGRSSGQFLKKYITPFYIADELGE